MQKIKYAVLLIAMVFVVALWFAYPDEVIEVQAIRTTSEAPTVSLFTEAELLDLFYGYAYADPANRMVTGCAVMPESDYGIIGVVQYTTEDEEGCLFDFLRAEGPPLQAGVEASPVADTLQHAGKDTVHCDIIGDDGDVHVCRLSFYQNDIEYGFKLETNQKEG